MEYAGENKLLNYVIRRWYDIGLVLAVPAIIWAIVGDLSTIQLILLLNFVVLLYTSSRKCAGRAARRGS